MKVGILGGTGYMGGEALRILLEHPEAEIAWVTSRSSDDVAASHRNLTGCGLKFIRPDQIEPCDVVFVALPSGKAQETAPKLLEMGAKVIDLGSDFRLRDKETWERVYGKTHTAWELMSDAVYGTTELRREELKNAQIVANPGCFSSAVIFGLAPLAKEGCIDPRNIFVDGLSGTAGAGAELHRTMHHPELDNNIIPYNVVDHRHTYEMEQELTVLAGADVQVHFTSCYVPISRGILAICHCTPTDSMNRNQLLELYRTFYGDEQFIQLIELPREENQSWQYNPYPWVSSTSGNNSCHIGLDIDQKRGRIVVFSVLDSVGKGGAHAGIQNMNLLFGLAENTGLSRYGLHPY